MRTGSLTKSQRELLAWMVKEVRAGRLNEEDIWFCWTFNGTTLVDYQGESIPEVEPSTLDALQKRNYLVCSRCSSSGYKCALTGEAYKVIDESSEASNEVKILFLASDPCDQARLRLGRESREIRESLQLSKQRDRFTHETREALRPRDITQSMHDFLPTIVHFAGHGEKDGALCFENLVGESQLVQPDALASLFELVSTQVTCVVLNACYSEAQASAIAKHIPFVIGMNSTIGDAAAIAFSTGFYKALGAGYSIERAYKFACVEIQLEGIPEHLTPVLKAQSDMQLLRSSCGIDYSILKSLLERQKWKEANEETARLIIKISGRESFGALDGGLESTGTLGDEDIFDLPCPDLQTIDNLWATHSRERFGLSIQSKILKKEDGDYHRFLDRVGWYHEEKLVFSLSAPIGHLPLPPLHFAVGSFWNSATLIERFRKCKNNGD